MKIDILVIVLSFSLGNGLSISKEGVKTKEAIKAVVKLKAEAERKSEGEIKVEFDRFSGGICFLNEHCAFFMMANTTVQISYCDKTVGEFTEGFLCKLKCSTWQDS